MKVYSQLEVASLENLSSDPALLPLGRFWYNTTTNRLKMKAAAGVKEIVTLDDTQTMTNKTLTSPAITTPTGIVKGDVGLGNVDNTSDATKNAASATLTNKTLTAPILDMAVMTDQGSTPASPSAGSSKFYTKTDGKAYLLNSSGQEVAIGTSSGVGLNFIDNGLADLGTTGWATYADAAGTRPVDGTAGSANVTWTVSTSTPLLGTNSFLFTKDAANRQGQGASYAFTVGNAQKAKVLEISFDYLVNSGTFSAGSSSADSDVIVYIYDVTNGVLIEPSSIKLFSNSTTIADKFKANFQTASNSTSYRLIFHVASTSASAYELKIDNIQVSPSVYVYGTPISDWASYTPTGSLSTNATYNGKWRRVGDAMEIYAEVALSGANTQGAVTINLPSGYSMDTNKLTNISSSLGTTRIYDSSGFTVYNGPVIRSSNTALNAMVNVASATYTYANVVDTSANIPVTFATSDSIIVDARFPIVGWGSSTRMSSETDTRVVAASKSNSNGGGGAAPLSYTNIPFGSVSDDTHGAWNSSTNQYEVKVAGWYSVYGKTEMTKTSFGAGDYVAVQIVLDSTSKDYGLTRTTGTVTTLVAQVSTLFWANAGQVIKIQGKTNASGTVNYTISDSGNSFTIQRLSGPAAIAANETVICRYSNTAGTSVTSSTTVIPYVTKVVDTHGAFNGTTFTAPVAGKYKVSASMVLSNSSENYIFIRKNGNATAYFYNGNTTVLSSSYVYDILDLVAGDTITIAATSTTTRTLNTSGGYNVLTIERVGL